MRLAILADIHGNYRALEAVLADIDQQGAEEIISIGDNIGYGPEPEEVVQTLIAKKINSVMGNHELGLISNSYFNRLNPGPQESLAISKTLLSESSNAWLRGLPAVVLRYGARFVHGCPPQSITTYLFDPSSNRLQRIFSTYPDSLCFAGHTHNLELFSLQGNIINKLELSDGGYQLLKGGRYIVLTGSVGQPRDHLNWHAKYIIWDVKTNIIDIRAIPYDVQSTIKLLGERGFPAFNAKRLKW